MYFQNLALTPPSYSKFKGMWKNIYSFYAHQFYLSFSKIHPCFELSLSNELLIKWLCLMLLSSWTRQEFWSEWRPSGHPVSGQHGWSCVSHSITGSKYTRRAWPLVKRLLASEVDVEVGTGDEWLLPPLSSAWSFPLLQVLLWRRIRVAHFYSTTEELMGITVWTTR